MTTKEFLSHFPDFCVQLFDDGPGKDQRMARCGTPGLFTADGLRAANDSGCGVFFSVNRFPGGRRRRDLCTGVNAWFCESDSLSFDEQFARLAVTPLPPTFVVKSKKSLHMYWLPDERGASMEGFRNIQLGLADYFQGDIAMKDIARVLRVPGFMHRKDPDHPFAVELIEAHPERHYSEETMRAAYPFVPPVNEPPQPDAYRPAPQINETEDLWEVLHGLPNKLMLQQLSGTGLVGGDIITFSARHPGEYIIVNGVVSDSWIDKDGMIGSGKGGGPTWLQWVRYYGTSWADIARWAKGGFGNY